MRKQSPLAGLDLDRAFERTPSAFSIRMEKAFSSPTPAKARRLRWLPVLMACLVLLAGGGLAAGQLGVLDFLTEMTGQPVDRAAVEGSVQKPLHQQCNARQVTVTARDYLWHEMTLSIALHAAPAEPDKYRLLSQNDFGVDGIHMDDIWWNGEVTSLDKWLPKGKQALVLDISSMTAGNMETACMYTWVPEELGETFLLSADLFQVTPERYQKMLGADGTLQLTIPVSSWMYGGSAREEAVLTLTIRAPELAEWRKLYDGGGCPKLRRI